jgi:hypothetical protein
MGSIEITVEVHAQDSFASKLLVDACKNGHVEIARLLLVLGALTLQ